MITLQWHAWQPAFRFSGTSIQDQVGAESSGQHHGGALEPRGWYLAIKRAADIGIASVLLLVLSPVLLTVALLIWLQDGASPIFLQERNGLHAKRFRIVKFRSMTAQSSLESFRQCQKRDSRVTPLGRFLRKTSIDELPQLLNVLGGSMSLIGPRPHPVKLDEDYGHRIGNYWLRYSMRPGLTGLAQVRGYRGVTDEPQLMAGRIRSDLEYIRECSLRLDLQILMRTAGVVVSGANAC